MQCECPATSDQLDAGTPMQQPIIELVNVTYAYRVRLIWPATGITSLIGDWPTKRLAMAGAAEYIRRFC